MTETSLASAATLSAASAARQSAPLARSGLAAAVGAFVIWGLAPIYLGPLRHLSGLEITAHRIVWSFVFVIAWLGLQGELGKTRAAVARKGVLPRLFASAALITLNWLVLVWAINNDHVLDMSLGYYINPLVNVLLGIFVLSERLSRIQWIAVTLAAAGVTYLAVGTGHFPWVAVTVACSFAVYGLIRKTAQVEALPGLAIELAILLPLAAGYVVWREASGVGALGEALHQGNALVATLLLCSVVVTAVPLYLFSYGARIIPYSTIGIIQYIAPSMQLLCAVLVLGEPFGHASAVGFALIWAALAVYAVDGLRRARLLTRPTS